MADSFFCGLRIVVNPLLGPVQKVRLSHDFDAVSPEFKREFNQWLLERFGTEHRAYLVQGKTLVVDPKTIGMIKGLTP